MIDRTYRDALAEAETRTLASEARVALELRPLGTDDELELGVERAVDWWRVLGCAVVAGVTLGSWGLAAWALARALRGG